MFDLNISFGYTKGKQERLIKFKENLPKIMN